jgi:hypothetical protein
MSEEFELFSKDINYWNYNIMINNPDQITSWNGLQKSILTDLKVYIMDCGVYGFATIHYI